MTTIGNFSNLSSLSPATRNFMDTRPQAAGERGFMDLDSTVHAILDRASVGNDNKSIYGLDLPRSTYDLFRSGGDAGSTAATEKNAATGKDAMAGDADADVSYWENRTRRPEDMA